MNPFSLGHQQTQSGGSRHGVGGAGGASSPQGLKQAASAGAAGGNLLAGANIGNGPGQFNPNQPRVEAPTFSAIG